MRAGVEDGGHCFQVGLEEKSPLCVCMCVRACMCAHMCVVSMCIVDSHVYTGAYYKPNAFLEESIALSDSRSQTLVSWVLGALRAPAPGPLHWPLPCPKLLSQLGQPPACRTLWWLPSQPSSGRKDHSLPAPCLSCGWDRGGPDYTSCLLSIVLADLLSICLPEVWESLGLETSPSYFTLNARHLAGHPGRRSFGLSLCAHRSVRYCWIT